MIATSSQPGMFPVASSNIPLTLVHTLPPPGSTTVSVQSLSTMPSTSGLEVIPVIPEAANVIPTISETKRVYPCTYCDKQFGSRYNASRHEKGCKLAPPGSGGNQADPEPILCPNCGKQFQTRDGMTRHLKRKCKLGVSPIETPAYRWTGKKVHMCKYCGKQFSTKWNAIRHENLFHTNDEPPLTSLMVVPCEPPLPEQQFVPRKPERYCRFCGNYFSTKYNAIRHERICTRISAAGGGLNANNTTVAEATSSTIESPMIQSQVTTVDIQSPAQNVPSTPQVSLQPQMVLQQRQQQQTQAPQQQQQQPLQHQQDQAQQQTQQLTQQLQQLQQVHQLQQVVQRQQQQQQQQHQQQQQQLQQQQQQQQQQHEVQQNHQQQIIVQQAQHQLQQQQQQHVIQQHQHQQTQPQQVQITPQQVVFIQPYHVCKFCNKQLHTKCDPTPVLREDIQNGTINAATLQAASLQATSLQVQSPIAPTIITGVSLPMLATIPAHNITIPIQPQTAQQQRAPNPQQIVTQQQPQPQQVQHQQVQLQIQPQQVVQQHAQVPQQQQIQQTQQQVQQQQPRIQPTPQPPQQQQPPVTQQTQPPTSAPPVPSSIQQKPHGCNYCNKHFATKWYLDQHVKIHTGQAVTCHVCNKSFVTRWHLDKHVRVHLPGGKKSKRNSVQSSDESQFNNSSSIINISEAGGNPQQNNINGAAEGIVTPMPNFSMADDRNQLQQFALSPLRDQNDK